MMIDPLVSVVVPVYNVERYVGQCLESILSQSYTNLEIIIVNDGSKDSSADICKRYADLDDRILLINKENGGLSSARNAALDKVHGKYLMYVDSDDYIKPEMIKNMVDVAEKENVDLVKCNFCRCTQDGTEDNCDDDTGAIKLFSAEEAVENFLTAPYSSRKYFRITVWDSLYLFDTVKNLRFPEGKLYEDGYYTPVVLLNCKKTAHIDTSFYVYRQNEGSIIGNGFTEKSLKSIDDWEFIYNHINKKMPQFSVIAAGLWLNKLIKTYENILSDDTVDKDNYYKNYVRERLSSNIELFKRTKQYKAFKKKISIIIEKPELFYEKFILEDSSNEPFKSRVKTSVYFIIKYYKEITGILKIFIKRLFRRKRKIFLLGTPSHNNIGDHAIALGTRKFVLDNFPDFDYVEYDKINDYLSQRLTFLKLKAGVSSKDIILFHGGGNLGNIYISEENYRRAVVKSFKNNKIVVLSSSIFFCDDFDGHSQLKRTKTIYNKHKDLTLFLRDNDSFQKAKEYFNNCKLFLMPDMALYLNQVLDYTNVSRHDSIYLCLRNDCEKLYEAKALDGMFSACKNIANTEVGDNAFSVNVTSVNREEKVIEYLKYFSSHKLIVTDRFHGVIFSFITNTPCIALDNNNGKIKNSIFWFKDEKNIVYLEDVDQIQKVIKETYDYPETYKRDFSEFFNDMKKIIEL